MKQTAVEYIVKEFSEILGKIQTDGLQDLLLIDAINKARQMERQQIMDAWEDGQNSFPTINAKKYYKEQFKNK